MTQSLPAPFFVGGALALDILNTRAAPSGTEVEWLGSGTDLLAWLEEAGAMPARVGETMRATVPPEALDAVAARARALREWFRRLVVAHAGGPLPASIVSKLEPLNALLKRDDLYVYLGAATATDPVDGRRRRSAPGLQWRWERRWHTPESLLLPLARAMAEFIHGADFTLVKACEGPGCTVVFLDVTKARARRWCSMAICGNRAKQAAHRARARSADASRRGGRRNARS